MQAITPTDLNNAKTDVDKISEFMESVSATMTTRLGASTKTRSGLIAELEADAAVTATGLNRAAAEEAQASAEEARDAAINAVSTDGAWVDGLIGDETTAIAIHAFEADAYAMKVVDAANPLNNRVGGLLDIITSIWSQPKLCTQTDRRNLKWSPHNFAKQTDRPDLNLNGATAVLAEDSDGAMKAATFTATSAVQAHHRQLTLSSSAHTGRYHMLEMEFKTGGTAPWGYIGINDGADKFAYFNLSTWALGTVAAGMTAQVSATRADGTVLPSGWRRITVYFQSTAATFNIYGGGCDADASKAITIGRTFTLAKPHLHLGVNALDYFENTTTSNKIGVPLDHADGSPSFLIEPAITFNSRYGDDLTNAAWTKANCTATLTTTGPHGEPCSVLTATATDATCLQAIVSAGTSQVFTVYLRRRTGTGSVFITTDNGATWEDVTSQLNSTTYTPLTRSGTTNPTIGFKIATNGDAIDVALAINAAAGVRASAVPVYGSNVVTIADNFIVPVSLMTAGSAYTVYVDLKRQAGALYPDSSNIRVGNAALTQESTLTVVAANGKASFFVGDGVTSKSYPIWTLTNAERLELTFSLKANQHVMSVNGELPAWITTVGMPTMEQVKIGHTAPVRLKRLLIVPRAVDRDEVRTWRYSGGVRNSVLDSAVVAWDRDAAVPGATMNREPVLCKLSDDGETADLAYIWVQKHDTGHHVEAPARIMQRNYRLTKSTGAVQALTAAAVIRQQAGWVSGLGHLQSPNLFVVPYGPNKGRVLMLFTQLDSASGTFSDDDRNIYVMVNDSGVGGGTIGDPSQWGTPTLVHTSVGQYAILDCVGSGVILPPSHPVAPNRIVTHFYIASGVHSLYSGDWGATWTVGTLFAPATLPNESAIDIRPDGTLVMTSRVGQAPTDRRNWATSTDGGVSWVDQGVLPSFAATACAAGFAQLDPTGVTGAYGKFALSHPIDAVSRLGLEIDFATDAAMTFGNPITPWATNRYFGYSSLKSLFGGSHMALAVEGGSVPFNTDNTCYLALIEAS